MTSRRDLLSRAKREGYASETVMRWIRFYGIERTEQILDAFNSSVKRSIFINFRKHARTKVVRSLKNKKFRLVPSPFHPNCKIVKYQPFSLSSTPEYLTGQFLILSETSVLPPLFFGKILKRHPEFLIDMTAAPGIKTSLLSLFFPRTLIFAIERNPERIVKLRANITRLGLENVACVLGDARKLKITENIADGVLLDAPCTGSGIIHKDARRKTSRSIRDIRMMSSVQKQLIKAGIKCVRENGFVIYSTCSLEPEENEDVISWVLDQFPVELIDVRSFIESSWINELNEAIVLDSKGAFKEEISRCVRVLPSSTRDGFFIAVLKKIHS